LWRSHLNLFLRLTTYKLDYNIQEYIQFELQISKMGNIVYGDKLACFETADYCNDNDAKLSIIYNIYEIFRCPFMWWALTMYLCWSLRRLRNSPLCLPALWYALSHVCHNSNHVNLINMDWKGGCPKF
jgi:hypothetical protein